MSLYKNLMNSLLKTYIHTENYLYDLSWKWDNFVDSIFDNTIYGRDALYESYLMTENDKESFIESLGKKVTDTFEIIFNPRGMTWVRKENLEEAVAYA